MIYILYICIIFFNKMNDQTCVKNQWRPLLKNGESIILLLHIFIDVFMGKLLLKYSEVNYREILFYQCKC